MHDEELNDSLNENTDVLSDDSIFEELETEDNLMSNNDDIDEDEDIEDDDKEIFDELYLFAAEEEEDEFDFYNDDEDF